MLSELHEQRSLTWKVRQVGGRRMLKITIFVLNYYSIAAKVGESAYATKGLIETQFTSKGPLQ